MAIRTRFIYCFTFLLTLLISFDEYAQDTAWQKTDISSEVSIDMPKPIIRMDTLQLKIIYSRWDAYTLQSKYIKTKFVVRNGDELIQGYDGFLKGFLNSEDIKAYKTTASDTTINGTTGEWIHGTYSKDSTRAEMYTYVVLVNNYFYIVSFLTTHGTITPAAYPMLSRYFSSLHFPAVMKEYSGDFPLQSKSYRFGQRLGAYKAYLLIAAIIVIVIILLQRRRERKKRH